MNRSWRMGRLAVVVLAAVVLATAGRLLAQGRSGAGGGRVACVDVVRIFNEYERQKDLTEEMRAIEQQVQNEIERRRGQIDSLQATIDALSDSDPLKVRRYDEFLQLQLDFKNWSELMQARMAREVGVWTQRVYKEILKATEEVAQRDGYDLVFYKEAPEPVGYEPDALKEQIRLRKLVWASPGTEITQQILDRLNADYRAQPKVQMLQISPTFGP